MFRNTEIFICGVCGARAFLDLQPGVKGIT